MYFLSLNVRKVFIFCPNMLKVTLHRDVCHHKVHLILNLVGLSILPASFNNEYDITIRLSSKWVE